MSITINWTKLGRQLRVAADSMAGLGGGTCSVDDAYQFLLDNPEAFGAPEDGWSNDMPQVPNIELIAAYYGYTKEPMSDPLAVAKGMAVDLLADIRKPRRMVPEELLVRIMDLLELDAGDGCSCGRNATPQPCCIAAQASGLRNELGALLNRKLPESGLTGGADTTYTVIGIYQDTSQVFVTHVVSTDPHEAIRAAAGSQQSGFSGDLEVLGAIKGYHDMTCACEDAGKSAYVADLIVEEAEAASAEVKS